MAAGKFGSASVVFLVDGYNLLSAKLKNLSYKIQAMTEPTHGLGDSWEEHTPTGLSSASITQAGGFFDSNTNASHAALSGGMPTTPQATQRIVCVGMAGNTIGAPFVGFQGAYSHSYDVQATVGELTKANAEYTISGQADRGIILQELEAKTADWNTKTDTTEQQDYTLDTGQQVIPIASVTKANPCVVTTSVPHGFTSGDIVFIASNTLAGPAINGSQTATVISTTTFSVAVNTTGSTGTGSDGTIVRANSANGGVGYLQVSAFSGLTNCIYKIRDSADDSTYADLITFTTVTSAPFAERATVSGTVDRYLLVDGNVTGTGSITGFVGFARG